MREVRSVSRLVCDCVVVSVAPLALPLNRHVQAGIGHTAHLACRFTGHPDFISWHHAGAGAPVTGSRYSVTRYIHEDIGAVDSRLSIDAVTSSDYGSYRCEASNVYSSTNAVVLLSGRSAIDNTDRRSQKLELQGNGV